MMKGADPNAVDKGNTKSVLMAAAMQGKLEMVDFLLQNRANPLYKNANGQSALSIAESLKHKVSLQSNF
jgi:ankyrin repeat protein